MTLAIIFAIIAIAVMCWLLFTLAIYALPFFAGLSTAMWAHSAGSGIVGAFAVGLVAAVVTLVVGQILFSTVRSPILRLIIALAFAVPAALAGYHAVHGLAAAGVSSEGWREAFAIVGAVVVGATAWARLANAAPLASPKVTSQSVGTRVQPFSADR